MSSPFDSPTITQGEADFRYLNLLSPQQNLTDQQKAAILSAIGAADGVIGSGQSQLTVDTDPDGTTVLVITIP